MTGNRRNRYELLMAAGCGSFYPKDSDASAIAGAVIAIIAIFAVGLVDSRRKPSARRRTNLFAFGLALILYTTLFRRIPNAIGKPASTARLELVGFNLSGCLLNALLFVPLGLSLRGRSWWFPIILSVSIEVIQQITHLGMFDVWDILANAIGGLMGIAAHMLFIARNRGTIKNNQGSVNTR